MYVELLNDMVEYILKDESNAKFLGVKNGHRLAKEITNNTYVMFTNTGEENIWEMSLPNYIISIGYSDETGFEGIAISDIHKPEEPTSVTITELGIICGVFVDSYLTHTK